VESGTRRSWVGGRMAAYTGVVTDIWRNFERTFVNGGVGGIISTTFGINKLRQSPYEYPTLCEDRFVPPLRQRLADIKAGGCKYIIQIGDPRSAVGMRQVPGRAGAPYFFSAHVPAVGQEDRTLAIDPA